jgi:hypothetical protein
MGDGFSAGSQIGQHCGCGASVEPDRDAARVAGRRECVNEWSKLLDDLTVGASERGLNALTGDAATTQTAGFDAGTAAAAALVVHRPSSAWATDSLTAVVEPGEHFDLLAVGTL